MVVVVGWVCCWFQAGAESGGVEAFLSLDLSFKTFAGVEVAEVLFCADDARRESGAFS